MFIVDRLNELNFLMPTKTLTNLKCKWAFCYDSYRFVEYKGHVWNIDNLRVV